MSEQHLAQLNIARLRAPLADPSMAEFTGNLARINSLAEAQPGFVWRLQDEAGDATGVEQPFGDGMIVNMTLWAGIEPLRLFTYRTDHSAFVRRRAEWFAPLGGPHLVLWWRAAGSVPSLDEAKTRLDHLAAEGPTAAAFTFSRAFTADGRAWRRG